VIAAEHYRDQPAYAAAYPMTPIMTPMLMDGTIAVQSKVRMNIGGIATSGKERLSASILT
jgi:hypothetical protein